MSEESGDVVASEPRRRVRVPTAKHRRRKRRRRIVRVAAGLIAVVVLLGAWAGFSAIEARRTLVAAQGQVRRAQQALLSADVVAARQGFARAGELSTLARAQSQRLPIKLVQWLPLVGNSFRVLTAVAEVADTAVDVSQRVADQADAFLDDQGGLDVQVADGRVDLTPLRAAAGVLDDLDLTALHAARERLAASPATWLPTPVRAGRRDALTVADQGIEQLEVGRALTDGLIRLLGGEGPRTYFVAVQTPGELRGTGGLIAYFALLSTDDGRLQLGDPSKYTDLEVTDGPIIGAPAKISTLGGRDGVPVSDEFALRYGHTGASSFLSNVNVDPDLPTTGPVLADLVAARTGERIDGVIALDLIGLRQLLEVVGPVEVPAELGGALGARFTPDRFQQVALVDVYEEFGVENGAARLAFFTALGDAAVAQIVGGGWDGVAMGRQMARAAGERHLQLYSRDEVEQQAWRQLRVAGRLSPRDDRGDLIAVTANNAVGGKMDVHQGYRFTGGFDLAFEPWRGAVPTAITRSGTLRTEVVNPLPSSGMDPYIIGNCPVGLDRTACFEGPPGRNRTWFSVWGSLSTQLSGLRSADGPVASAVQTIHDSHVVDAYLEVAPESSAWIDVDTRDRVTVTADGPDVTYRFTWWHQAKAIPDVLDLSFAVPDGWSVADASLATAGDGSGTGVLGDGALATVEVEAEGRVVRVVGNVTADAVLEIRLTRGLWPRFTQWLGRPVG